MAVVGFTQHPSDIFNQVVVTEGSTPYPPELCSMEQ